MLFYNKVLAATVLLVQFIYETTCQGPPVFLTQASANTVRVNANRVGLQAVPYQISQGAEKFCLEFLKQISDAHISVPTRSFMVSPFAVWSLLLLLTEGAGGTTLTELRNTLHTGNDQTAVRAAYKIILPYLTVNTTTIEVASFNALFTNINKPVNRDYENIIERDYGSALIPVDFDDVNNTFTKINKDIRAATRGLLPYTVTPQDFQDANILMISSLYFKGKWKRFSKLVLLLEKVCQPDIFPQNGVRNRTITRATAILGRYPFEFSKTRPLPFHDEDGNILGNVDMMTQLGPFTYVNVRDIEASVLELPYGKENRLSMLIVFPKIGVKLNKVVHGLARIGTKPILQQLQKATQYYVDEEDKPEVEVFLPKFTTESHFSLRPILKNMGIHDLFDVATANLDKIATDNYVTSVFHATRIIVNEEGTEAGAVTTAVLGNKASPSQFYVDRPFAYLIIEKTANVLLFAGEVRNYKDNVQ